MPQRLDHHIGIAFKSRFQTLAHGVSPRSLEDIAIIPYYLTQYNYPFSENYPGAVLEQIRQLYSYLNKANEHTELLPNQMRQLADHMDKMVVGDFGSYSPKAIAADDANRAASMVSDVSRLRELPQTIKAITDIIDVLAVSPVVLSQLPSRPAPSVIRSAPEHGKTVSTFDPRAS